MTSPEWALLITALVVGGLVSMGVAGSFIYARFCDDEVTALVLGVIWPATLAVYFGARAEKWLRDRREVKNALPSAVGRVINRQ